MRGRGLMFGIDLRDAVLADRIHADLIEEGFIVCNRQALFRIDPPLTIRPAEFDLFVQAFERVL